MFDRPSTCGKVWDRLLSGVVMDALEAGTPEKVAEVADEGLLSGLRRQKLGTERLTCSAKKAEGTFRCPCRWPTPRRWSWASPSSTSLRSWSLVKPATGAATSPGVVEFIPTENGLRTFNPAYKPSRLQTGTRKLRPEQRGVPLHGLARARPRRPSSPWHGQAVGHFLFGRGWRIDERWASSGEGPPPPPPRGVAAAAIRRLQRSIIVVVQRSSPPGTWC